MSLGILTKLLERWVEAPPIRTEMHQTDWVSGVAMIIRREVNLLGSFSYTPNIFAEALRWIAAERIVIDPWLIKAPLAEGRECFERLLGRPGPVAKILLY